MKTTIPGLDEFFVQENTDRLVICYTQTVIKAVCNLGQTFNINNLNILGIRSIVSDGIHRFHRDQLGEHGQIYTITAITNCGLHVPLIHSFCGSKTTEFYRDLFQILKVELEANLVDTSKIKFVVDFEQASIAALRQVTLAKNTNKKIDIPQIDYTRVFFSFCYGRE